MSAVQSLPCGSAPVIVLAPHPDDESLGCGLLLAEIWCRGTQAHVVCLTDGAASHRGSTEWSPDKLAALRQAELSNAISELGGDPTHDVTWLGLPDAALDQAHGPGCDPVRSIVALVDELGAGTLVAASPADPHCDHLAGGRAALRVKTARPALRLLFYPIWSRWQLHQAGVDMESQVPIVLDLPCHRSAKRAAIGAHRSQLGQVVVDDPDGFVLPDGFVDYFADAPEHYFPVGR